MTASKVGEGPWSFKKALNSGLFIQGVSFYTTWSLNLNLFFKWCSEYFGTNYFINQIVLKSRPLLVVNRKFVFVCPTFRTCASGCPSCPRPSACACCPSSRTSWRRFHEKCHVHSPGGWHRYWLQLKLAISFSSFILRACCKPHPHRGHEWVREASSRCLVHIFLFFLDIFLPFFVVLVAEAKSDVPESCKFQLQTFDKCLEKSEDPSQCQWIYEDLQSCKKSSKF